MKLLVLFAVILVTVFGCKESTSQNQVEDKIKMDEEMNKEFELSTFGSGCFWCTEAIFERVKGVISVESGYSGGKNENPTYEEVCSGKTGYAEVVQIKFDTTIISFDELLEIFWKTHDPTTLNKQGADVGTQYRSVIFYHNENQKQKAGSYKNELNNARIWNNEIVTEIVPFTNFYSAEKYHQNYYEQNPNQGYCSFVITPKIEKFDKVFKDKLKNTSN